MNVCILLDRTQEIGYFGWVSPFRINMILQSDVFQSLMRRNHTLQRIPTICRRASDDSDSERIPIICRRASDASDSELLDARIRSESSRNFLVGTDTQNNGDILRWIVPPQLLK
jgi:hypothetical protein